ncbi:hypothetical protein [Phormidesmis priestleyi]|nr:hypothetical protein [Phormidesmis priestleyi]
MNEVERFQLMKRKACLKAELLELTKDIEGVQAILYQIREIDERLGA